jgi:hypothetical protein
MKKHLLNPPEDDGAILFLPDARTLRDSLRHAAGIRTAHQPYFFNPGVSLKFLFLEALPAIPRQILFLDTDRTKLEVLIPSGKGFSYRKTLCDDARILRDYPALPEEELGAFFSSIEETLAASPGHGENIRNVRLFREIVMGERSRYLKDVLARSFLKFYNIESDYTFISDIVATGAFRDFSGKICADDSGFREIFNRALDDYGKEYRFRYAHFPFPKLERDELPFWVVEDGIRRRCYKRDVRTGTAGGATRIVPRASTLTLFLRLSRPDIFIHGTGGVNYERVNDRIIEDYFKTEASPCIAVSGTFLVSKMKEREFPYFYFDARMVKTRLKEKWEEGAESTIRLTI